MKIASAYSTHPDPRQAAEEAYRKLIDSLQQTPNILLAHASCLYDTEVLIQRLSSLAPGIPIQGGTSCLGVMTEMGFHSDNAYGFGLLGLSDRNGDYGAGMAVVGNDPQEAARKALDQALSHAGRSGEAPAVVLVCSAPGNEESILQAIEKHVGIGVPIIGGTAADNDMSGQWRQFADSAVAGDGVSVAVLFPSCEIGFSFHSGYEPTDRKGRVTRAEGRILYEIDGLPAATVYNDWTGGLIESVLPSGGNLVPTATFSPLGTPVGCVGVIPYYRLSYPVEVLPGGALSLFTEVHAGHEIELMTGTPDSLISRTGRVAAAAVDAAPFSPDEVEGALVLFCTGCMLAVQERISGACDGLRSALKNAPFLCAFTLGEQGCFIGGENRHGNLMVVVLTFGPDQLE